MDASATHKNQNPVSIILFISYIKCISSFGAKAAFFGAIGLKKPDLFAATEKTRPLTSQAAASWRRSYFLCRQKEEDGGGVHERVPDSSFPTEFQPLVCWKKQQKGRRKKTAPCSRKKLQTSTVIDKYSTTVP